MNLIKLFEAQKVLMERIEREHPLQEGEDRFNKRVLALLVEVGECANEFRGFKFWSKDQKPRVKVRCEVCEGEKEIFTDIMSYECPRCEGIGIDPNKNPLLEEYADGLHFILELGIVTESYYRDIEFPEGKGDVNEWFLEVFYLTNSLYYKKDGVFFSDLLECYIGLGAALGFSWEEIETAYFEKHSINIKRQDSGVY